MTGFPAPYDACRAGRLWHIAPSLRIIRWQRIVQRMIFVELSPFVAFRAEHWSDDDVQEDLAREQVKILAELMKDIING